MYHKPSKKRLLIQQITIYSLMTLAVFVIATFIILFVMGYRFNLGDGRIEQYSFLQYASSPTEASVTIDGVVMGSKTPTKSSVPEGLHQIVISRDGYNDWNKTVTTKAGTITWLSYALLVPKNLNVESVAKYDNLFDSKASIKGKKIIVQPSGSLPAFELVDISSDIVKTTKLTMTTDVYSKSGVAGVKHTFQIIQWDDGGRYLLIKHSFDSSEEWLVFDTQDVSRSKNITRLLNIKLASVRFSGTSGNVFFGLDSSDIRKLDLSSETISKPLVGNVKSFKLYENNIITYVGVESAASKKQVVGVYRDGDAKSHIIKSFTDSTTTVDISTTHYFNEDYIAILEDKKIEILSGDYPSGNSDNTMKSYAAFVSKEVISEVTFSPNGQYVVAKSGNSNYISYDLEYQNAFAVAVDGKDKSSDMGWLNENYLWTNRDGYLVIRDFDGVNVNTINTVSADQDVFLTNNGRHLYSFGKSGAGYQLQRVRMILP